MNKNIIIIENLSKSFKGIEILKNINVKFESGKIYGIMGRNGCGKSVLFKLICGFYKPSSGSILLNNVSYVSDDSFLPNTRALIENPAFLPDLTGYENLRFLASIQKNIGDEEIFQTLKDVNLYDEKDKKYSKYSLGMKQKLGIAQVLMEKPEIMIFDEPFNSLEEVSVEKIKNIFLEEKKKGKIILLSSHIKDDIVSLADEVYTLDNGELKLTNL